MQQPGPRRPPNEQRAPVWAALGAAFGVLLAGLVAIPGCLNPRPEEDPSALELADPEADSSASRDDVAPSAADPVRETCDDNPLLGECAAPPPSIGAGDVEPPADAAAPPAEAPDAGGSSVYDAGAADAGASAAASSPLLD